MTSEELPGSVTFLLTNKRHLSLDSVRTTAFVQVQLLHQVRTAKPPFAKTGAGQMW